MGDNATIDALQHFSSVGFRWSPRFSVFLTAKRLYSSQLHQAR